VQSLREMQRSFSAAALFGDAGALAELAIVAGTLDVSTRIAVYRNNVLGNYRRALAATYPVVRRLVGDRGFNALIEAFVRAHPSRQGDVNRYGGELARFLSSHAPKSTLAYLPDVARVEWAIDQANIAADAPPLDLVALGSVPAEAFGELRFELHPSAQLIASRYPIFRVWQVNQPNYAEDDHVDLGGGDGGDMLLVRRATDGVTLERLGAGEHAFLAALARNACLRDAERRAADADESFDLAGVLKTHVAAQTIVAFRAPSTAVRGPRS
jgi:hypothetical protein